MRHANYEAMTNAQLRRLVRTKSTQSNRVIKNLKKNKLLEYSSLYKKKWEPIISNPRYGTKHGYFRTAGAKNKGDLIELAKRLEEFERSAPYLTEKYVRDRINEFGEKFNITNEDLIKNLFDVYRKFNSEAYADSDKLLDVIAVSLEQKVVNGQTAELLADEVNSIIEELQKKGEEYTVRAYSDYYDILSGDNERKVKLYLQAGLSLPDDLAAWYYDYLEEGNDPLE